MQRLSPRQIILVVVILLLIIVGALIWRYRQQSVPIPAPPEPGAYPQEKGLPGAPTP